MAELTKSFFVIALLYYYSHLPRTYAESGKGYIDLLDLQNNDQFHWGREHAIKRSLLTKNDKVVNNTNEAPLQDTFRQKRQSGSIVKDNQLLENKEYGVCRTPTGEEGTCRHVIYCRMPELKDDIWRMLSQLCVIEKSAIGICCPTRIIGRLGPQIIANVNNNDLSNSGVINQPEQRGCGIATRQFPRVTGGRPAEPDEWPWMAAILRPGLSYVWCGGVLVTDRHVLTAAHCIHKIRKENLFVRLGEYNTLLLNETRARDFRIGAMVTHIDYDPLTYEHDIGLIRVHRPTIFNTYIWPVCMPPIGENWEDKMAIVTGWGSKNFGGPHSDILMEVTIPVWKLDDCREAMLERITEGMLCAGFPEGGQDSCQGDSGGPLLLQLPNRRWVTIGIVSWGVRCGEPNRPGMYTRVDRYLHWIVENSDV
ncbi:venom protease [Glossina fuscipes]|uniref:Phenoloxidase-activating factor 2 n=1 Tax=Glossina fuscipes TaxID=7396 RepID=A0A9C6E2C6_9MUSC|nr:venom protease [Glossina fuscipes]XP_037901521.1 venom protease [Glossina fuscipes]XP_037901522.1 venom protease [Glossina fuscipes]